LTENVSVVGKGRSM